MPRYRMQYAKEGPASYISHLDLLRVFERSARRAGLPLELTKGFNPHPKITFAAPLGVGTAGKAEFADLELAVELPARQVSKALSATLPEGLKLVEARKISDDSPPLMAMVDRATYQARARLRQLLNETELKKSIESFLSMPEIIVQRKNKSGENKAFDIRPGIFDITGSLDDGIIELEAEIKTGSSGNVRLEEVLNAFEKLSGVALEGRFVLCRTGLFKAGIKGKQDLW